MISILASLALSVLVAVAPPPPEKPNVSDVAFLAGVWHGESEGAAIDEHWTTPAAGTLVGMFRWTKSEKVELIEMFVIAEKPGEGLVFTLRHFDAGLVGREDANSPCVFRLVELVPGKRVVFERIVDAENATRVGYEKKGDGALHSTVEMKRAGKTTTIPFDYVRR